MKKTVNSFRRQTSYQGNSGNEVRKRATRKDGGRFSLLAPIRKNTDKPVSLDIIVPKPVSSRQRSAAFHPFSREGLSLAAEKLVALRPFRNQDFDIDVENDVKIHRKIAQGAFGTIHEAIFQNKVVAVKTQSIDNHEQSEAGLLCELTILRELHHERLVDFYGAGFKDNSIYFVMELCEGGALRECLRQNLGWLLKIRIALDIASGINFLHSKEIMHRDIKTPNVLIDSKWRAKLCDFNFCIDASSPERYNFVCGTKEFMSPEMNMYDYEPSTEFGIQSDMYSFGVVLAEMITEIKPGHDQLLNLQGTFEDDFRVDTSQVNVHSLAGAPDSLVTLTVFCLACDPEERTTSEQAVEWLEDLLKEQGGDQEIMTPASCPPPIDVSMKETRLREGGVRQSIMTPQGTVEVVNEALSMHFPSREETRQMMELREPDPLIMQEGLEELYERLNTLEAETPGLIEASANRTVLIDQLNEEINSLHEENALIRRQLDESLELVATFEARLASSHRVIMSMQEEIALNRKVLQEGVSSTDELPDVDVVGDVESSRRKEDQEDSDSNGCKVS